MNICDLRNLNQGVVDCDFELSVPKFIVFAPTNTVIEFGDLMGQLHALTQDSDPLKRAYPIAGRTWRTTDESTEPTEGSLDMGYTKQLLPGRAVYMLEWPSSVCSDRNIMKFNKYNGGALIINVDRLLIGSRNENGSMSPLPVEVSVWGGGFSGSGGEIQTIRMRVDFGMQPDLLALAMAYKLNINDRIETLRGLRDIELQLVNKTTESPFSATFRLVTGCDNVNLFDRFPMLATATNWRVNGVAPSAIATVAAQKAYTLTFSARGHYEISLAPVDVLKDAGIIGFEAVPFTITI